MSRMGEDSMGDRVKNSGKKRGIRRAAAALFCAAIFAAAPTAARADGESGLAEAKGAADTGFHWRQEEGGLRYVDGAGQPAAPGWTEIEGNYYWLEDGGIPRTGWLRDGDRWYYLSGSGAMVTGWSQIDGKYYYMREDGSMESGVRTEDETIYSFAPEGNLVSAKRKRNTGGGAFPIAFYPEECQGLADNLNELKADAFDGDEEDDYYEDDKKDYDRDASFVISGKLTEIAEHRLAMARQKGYGSGKIPEEGELSDYLKAIGYSSSRRSMEVYLINCDGADEAEAKLLRNHGEEEKKRSDRAVYYTEMGIAHEEVNGKDYYMVVFMK